ncbi:PREDICTED: ATP-dependent RNA helicase DDX19A-like [Mandrillus leucophaeus]|uniref:ATP-dependent RNA helicase DDX19A-like n=1 Tax=Mandrillus leucophaeus TaxID=9568 RepID=UPI0005F449CF|nr:PREDICTED: ATP-dependent RNA helicase DDX19A-like [Mandrillus leucophaeus]
MQKVALRIPDEQLSYFVNFRFGEKHGSPWYSVAAAGRPQTRKTASWLAAELSKEGHQVALLSGEMMVEQRAAVIERFREGKEKVLVTTNVCARGIDVEQVSVVINFDLPVDKDGNPDNETYLHRIGRTGRFGKRGLAVNMVDSKHSMNILNRIQEHFSFPWREAGCQRACAVLSSTNSR